MSAAASVIVIKYDGVDITRSVLFSDCTFESAIQATPGAFNVTLKDPKRLLGPFVTGKELTVDLDGIRVYGGYGLQTYRRNFFPAVRTSDLSKVTTRQWVIKGMDYNFKLDKLVLYNHANPVAQVDNVAAGTFDGAIIRSFFGSVFDFDDDWDLTTFVQDIHKYDDVWAWQTPGSTARDQLTDLANFGAFFYIDANKALHYEPVQALVPTWGFSDSPAASRAVGGQWIGYREGQSIDDATAQTDDAFVWGGNQFANNGKGAVVFGRKKDDPTIAAHGRWQYAETHIGDSSYASQKQVQARANAIITGASDGTVIGAGVGMLLPEDQYTATWFGKDVPQVLGVPQHLVPGAVTPLDVWTFSEDGGATPFHLDLPLKQCKISFPTLKNKTGKPYVRFDGFFGISPTDPNWLWNFLLKQSRGSLGGTKTQSISIATGPPPAGGGGNPAPPPPVGTFYSGQPLETPDGSNNVFHFPFSYIAGTVAVFLNGLLQRPGIDFFETDPSTGQFDMSEAPAADDTMLVQCRTSGVIVTAPSSIPDTIDATGATDVSTELAAFLNSLPPGTVVYFDPGAIYRCDSALKLFGVNQVRFEGQSCTIDGSHGTDYTENGSIFYTRGSGLKFHAFNVIGSSPTPGTFISGHEGQHGFLVDGGDDIEIWGCTSVAMFGDFVEINSGATNWSVHDNSVPNTGRNGLSVIYGNTGSFFNNDLPHCGYMPVDIEPNTSSETCHDIDAYSNAIGYWSNLAFATDGSATGAAIFNIKFRDNVFTGHTMAMEINPSHPGTEVNIEITGNVSDTPASGPVIQLWNCNGVTVTGNTQPLSSGVLVSAISCTGVTDSPNP